MKQNPISVLITGASTGIGHAIAVDLARSGHQVFASVRKESDAKGLTDLGLGIIPLIFDVTDTPGIQKARDEIQVRRFTDRPFSLVNNAGIAVPGPLEELAISEFKKQFAINVIGTFEVTQVCLPIIHEKRGRIVNMSSLAGLMASPFLGAYSASKFALEAMSDSLRMELSTFGIEVLLIEPGPIQTPIWDKNLNSPRTEVSARYQKPLDRFERYIRKTADRGLPPEAVVQAVRRALFETNPQPRQIVTNFQSKLGVKIGKQLPARWIDRLAVKQLFRD